MQEQWRLESETPDGNLVFGAIDDVEQDSEGNFYLLDYMLTTVHVVSPLGAHVRSLGREGTGPGEFSSVEDCFLTLDRRLGVVEYNRQRINFLALDGTPAGEWTPHGFGELRVRPLDAAASPHGIVASCRLLEPLGNQATLHLFLGLFDWGGSLKKKCFSRTVELRRGHTMTFDESASEPLAYFALASDGAIYVAPHHSEYQIVCLDPFGEHYMTIMREYDHLSRSPDEVERTRENMNAEYGSLGSAVFVPSPFERDVFGLRVLGEYLWVETSVGWFRPGTGNANVYDVFDKKGRFVRQAVLRGAKDPVEDYFYLLDQHALRITFGVNSLSAWVGSARDTSSTPQEALQTVICYHLVEAN
ncbi:MAG: hypothetical protein V2A71_05425 [Candidatus Eisenbacteria bacterium]